MNNKLKNQEKIEKVRQKSLIPPFVGIASVWFGTHVGPGIASGKQVVSYYAAFGKLGIFTPILAMALLGIAIYFALEYSRVNKIHDFKTFTNKFFHPYEKLFSLDLIYCLDRILFLFLSLISILFQRIGNKLNQHYTSC